MRYLIFIAIVAIVGFGFVIYQEQIIYPKEWNERMNQPWLKDGETAVNDILN